MKRTITSDDITGAEVSESQETKIVVGDVSGTLDLGPESLAALTALANGEGPAMLAALLVPTVPAMKRASGRKRNANRDGKPDPETGASPDEIRAWAKANGLAVNERGRVPEEVKVKFRAAHASAPAAPASKPANIPTGTPGVDTGADPRTMTGSGKPASK